MAGTGSPGRGPNPIPSPGSNSLEENSARERSKKKLEMHNVPKNVKKDYIKIDGKYFFVQNPEALAFQDKGHRLETTSTSSQVSESMIDIAQAKGWSKIKVKGDMNFRREVWLQAAARGIDIKGYTPRDEDLARLKKMVREAPEKRYAKQPPPEDPKPPNKDKGNSPPVEHLPPSNSEKNKKEVKNAKALLNRTTNLVELAKQNPELINEIAAIKIGEKLSWNISDKRNREVFMTKIRTRVAENYLQGQEMPSIKIKEGKVVEQPNPEKEVESER